MKFNNSYSCKIVGRNISLFPTISIYRSAISYLIKVYSAEWNNLKDLSGKQRNNFAEKLIHKTKQNPNPKYNDFNTK